MSFIKKNLINRIVKTNKIAQLKEELNELKENIMYAQKMTKMGSWTYYIEAGHVFWSEEVYNMLEISEKMEEGIEGFYKYIHPEDLEKVKETVKHAKEGKKYDIEFKIITATGKEKYLKEKAVVILKEDNMSNCIIGVIQDITEYKLLENNLIELDNEFNATQRVAGMGNWKYDLLEDKFYVSDEMCKIYDIEPTDFKSNFVDTMKLIHPEDQYKIIEARKKHLQGESATAEFRIPQKNGGLKYVASKGEPIFDENGQVVAVFGTIQDITENKLLQTKLENLNRILTRTEALAKVGSWELDIVNNKSLWSDETYKIYGVKPEDYDGTFEKFLKYIHPEDIPMLENALNNPPKTSFPMEFRFMKQDGSTGYVYQIAEFIFNKDNKPIYVYGTIQDVTELRELEKKVEAKQNELSKLQKKFQVLVKESLDVFEIITTDGTTKYISDATEKITGYKVEERIGKKIWEFHNKEGIEQIKKMIDIVLSYPTKKAQGDIVFKTKEGKKIYLEVNMQNLLDDSSIEGITINFRDITRRIDMEKQMAYITTHDRLTGLPNQTHFFKKLRLQCQFSRKNKTPFALMMLDIDGLKNINYSLGYEIGNQLIIRVIDRLKDYLGEDTFISRYSDDHFAIIVHGLRHLGDYETIAKGIINLFKKPFRLKNYELNLNGNIGICVCPKDANDLDSLRKHSKLALMRAKKEGKNTYKFYAPDLDIKSYKEFVLKSDLHNAIEENQLSINYQPIINLKTNEILGAEALLRWKHPEWGIVDPDDFIYLAEETDIIIDIGKWTLRELCRKYKKWIEKGLPPIKISINFSAIQFYEKNFIDNIIETLEEFQLDPSFLIIEITENILLRNTDKVVYDIKTLQSYGIQIAIDDFGTGFSSLTYLTSFNIDILKLDKLFIKNLPSNETNSIITKSVINLAKELKIKIVAEGIENWEQLTFLKGLNCYTGQGFIFSEPVPDVEFEKILAKKHLRPVLISNLSNIPFVERRKFFRVKFIQFLEANLTILEFNGRRINVGNTKVLVKNIGPGGLCFITNIKFPVERDIILQFSTELLDQEIKIYGCPVWTRDIDDDIYEYGIEFTIDENERTELIRILNQVQFKIRKNEIFAEGSFVSGTYSQYFTSLKKRKN